MESQEKELSRHQKWYRDNKEKAYACSRKWLEKNRAKVNAWHKGWRDRNKDRLKIIEKRRYDKDKIKRCLASRKRSSERRLLIIKSYGSKCACCGENKLEFLSIDHVKGGGRKERREKGVQSFYLSIVKRNFPSDYRILCHNCNQSLGFYKYCPHNKEFK